LFIVQQYIALLIWDILRLLHCLAVLPRTDTTEQGPICLLMSVPSCQSNCPFINHQLRHVVKFRKLTGILLRTGTQWYLLTLLDLTLRVSASVW